MEIDSIATTNNFKNKQPRPWLPWTVTEPIGLAFNNRPRLRRSRFRRRQSQLSLSFVFHGRGKRFYILGFFWFRDSDTNKSGCWFWLLNLILFAGFNSETLLGFCFTGFDLGVFRVVGSVGIGDLASVILGLLSKLCWTVFCHGKSI